MDLRREGNSDTFDTESGLRVNGTITRLITAETLASMNHRNTPTSPVLENLPSPSGIDPQVQSSRSATPPSLPTVLSHPLIDTSVLERTCWVCFAGDDEEPDLKWLRPCRCRGSTKWVHYSCLQRWVDSQQKGSVTLPVACPQCGAFYLLKFGSVGVLHKILDGIERTINKSSPYMAGICLVGATYWAAVSYGALTVLQLLGHKEGLQMMERADPLSLLIALPSVPAFLVWGKMLRWEDYFARWWPSFAHTICPHLFPRPQGEVVSAEHQTSPSRILCGALLFPTIAVFVGRVFFNTTRPHFRRTVFGGIFYVVVKGIFKIYYKVKHNEQYQKREILDAPETRDADTQATGDFGY
ncbi:hypothetical protein RvY_04928 [Ramazzottius varieornatus]|uniref:E3 ubiquitin-protein ligase MARCHF5 n=1 Tax=Ramazzottius varieornatus TaxID=947166 RepID=A0A1D1UWG5_RAMVA|nr:hypothetical protein RvY_04928 [Ramazzottius varieornatus]